MKRWRFSKNDTTFKQEYKSEVKIYQSRFRAFWSALDTICEGNIFYDFYWWYIWSNIKKFFSIPKRIHKRAVFKKQRIKYSVASEDIWGWSESILEYFDNGFKMFINQVWGKDVEYWTDEQWKDWNNNTYDRKFYNKIIDFQKNMEGLRAVRKELDELKYPENHKLGDPLPEDYSQALLNLANNETLCITSAWKSLVYILNKYHWNLWT